MPDAPRVHQLMIGGVVLAVVLLLTVLGVSRIDGSPEPYPEGAPRQVTTLRAGADELSARRDRFGVQKIYPTAPDGMVWYSDWEDGIEDAWVDRVGSAAFTVGDNGVLELSGETMRMYVREPAQRQQWTGALEVTVYAQRMPGQTDDAPPYSGIVTDVRTNHGTSGDVDIDSCDSRGLFARLRFDGTADFGKEVQHPQTVAANEVRVWDGPMPEGEWIGYKHIVYTTAEAHVVQELWVDFPGDRGEDWVLTNKHTDTGYGWGAGEESCNGRVRPDLPLYGGTVRRGSESGLPNLAVLFRADGLGEDGLEYRWASVRQVTIQR